MTDQTPAETVARALVKYETGGMCLLGKKCQMCDCGVQNMDRAELAENLRRNQDRARHGLASLAQHRDDIARVLVPVLDDYWCGNHVDLNSLDEETDEPFPCCKQERAEKAARLTDAVLAYLAGGQ